MKTHDDVQEIYECDQCTLVFSRKDNLTAHMNIHQEDRKMFECDQCTEKFTEQRNLIRHVETVHETKVFKCDECKLTFPRKDNYSRHQEIHNEQSEIYNCPKCRCPYRRKDNMKKHLKCHDIIQDEKRKKAQAKRKQESRKNKNAFEAFFESVRYGAIFICVCCHQKHFESNVDVFSEDLCGELEQKFPTLFEDAIIDDEIKKDGTFIRRLDDIKVDKDLHKNKSNLQNYICKTCTRHLKKGKCPPMSYMNGLGMYKYKDGEKETLDLSEVSVMLIAKNAIFQKIYLLPKSRWSAVKDKLINVPIPEDVVQETINSLPKLPTKAGLTAVKFKRKKEYKSAHKQEYIDPKKILRALKIFKEKHPEYKDIEIIENFEQLSHDDDPDIHSTFFGDSKSTSEENQENVRNNSSDTNSSDIEDDSESGDDEDVDEPSKKDVDKENFEDIRNKEVLENIDAMEEEDDYYKKNDPIRKFQFDYNDNIVLTERDPGAYDNVGAPSNRNKDNETDDTGEPPQVDFAPGEGQIPSNILKDDKWDIKTMPHLFPTGEWGLNEERDVKLTNQLYFQQRLLNYDERFAKCPSFMFAATQYIEQKQLERNVNVSFTRGKRTQGPEGTSTYTLDDGFSVLDNISNTPR